MMYESREPPQEPPCEDCMVIPLPENKDACEIFGLVNQQFIMGFNGPVAINQVAVHEAMRLYGIKNRRECFRKVMTLCDWDISRILKKDG